VAALWGISLAGLSGCIAAAGVVAYARGDLDSTVSHDYSQVVEAVRRAIGELEFAKVSENKDALKAVLVARTALDRKIEITVGNSGKKLTSIKIRVGILGDEALSLAILDKIKAGL